MFQEPSNCFQGSCGILAAVHEGSNVFLSLPELVTVLFFAYNHSGACEVVSLCSFNWNFPNN
jgi:hypothetical protein